MKSCDKMGMAMKKKMVKHGKNKMKEAMKMKYSKEDLSKAAQHMKEHAG